MNITNEDSNQSSWVLIAVILTIVIGILLFWKYGLSDEKIENIEAPEIIQPIEEVSIIKSIQEDVIIEEPMTEVVIEAPQEIENLAEEIIEEPIQTELQPRLELDESDSWIQEALASIVWRKELLDLVMNDDMIRRFVVFVDNFSQGTISYSNSPFVKPLNDFHVKGAINNSESWEIDPSSFNRFSRYVALFKAADTDILIEKYIESQSLIEEAYAELGYSDNNFSEKLEASITKVLDIEYPKGEIEVIQPSVMYRYKDASIESLDDAEKLMIRLGKENLLVIKSVLLEVNEKLK